MLIGVKMKKNFLPELGHSDSSKIHVNLSKIYVNPGI